MDDPQVPKGRMARVIEAIDGMRRGAEALRDLTTTHVVLHRPPTVVLGEGNPGVYRVFSTVNYIDLHKGDELTTDQVRVLVADPSVDVEIN